MDFENAPYLTISKQKQKKHDPRIRAHRRDLQPTEVARIHYAINSKRFTLSLKQRKTNVVAIGTASEILGVLQRKIKKWDTAELMFCHADNFKNKKKIQQLISRDEQNLSQYLLCLI